MQKGGSGTHIEIPHLTGCSRFVASGKEKQSGDEINAAHISSHDGQDGCGLVYSVLKKIWYKIVIYSIPLVCVNVAYYLRYISLLFNALQNKQTVKGALCWQNDLALLLRNSHRHRRVSGNDEEEGDLHWDEAHRDTRRQRWSRLSSGSCSTLFMSLGKPITDRQLDRGGGFLWSAHSQALQGCCGTCMTELCKQQVCMLGSNCCDTLCKKRGFLPGCGGAFWSLFSTHQPDRTAHWSWASWRVLRNCRMHKKTNKQTNK